MRVEDAKPGDLHLETQNISLMIPSRYVCGNIAVMKKIRKQLGQGTTIYHLPLLWQQDRLHPSTLRLAVGELIRRQRTQSLVLDKICHTPWHTRSCSWAGLQRTQGMIVTYGYPGTRQSGTISWKTPCETWHFIEGLWRQVVFRTKHP